MACRTTVIVGVLVLLGADWPHYLGPNRDGHSAETGLAAWAVGGPPVLWTKEIGAGFAGVVVAERRAFAFYRRGNEEVLQAFDAATGKELWTASAATKYVDDFGFDDGPRATPLVAGGLVVTLGANGDLIARDAASGKPAWQRSLRADFGAGKGYFGVAGSPMVAAGFVLVGVGAKGAGVVAVALATGKTAWKAGDDEAGYSSPTLAKLGGRERAVFLTRAGLLVLDPATGEIAARHPFRSRLDASVNGATPLVRGDAIFLSSSYGTGAALLKLAGATVEELWANDAAISSHYNTPVRVGDLVYGVHGRAEGGGAELRCVAWADGSVKWKEPRFGCASLLAVDGSVLALTEAGEVVRFDADAGKYTERGRAKVLAGVSRAAPALADGRLYVRDAAKLVVLGMGK